MFLQLRRTSRRLPAILTCFGVLGISLGLLGLRQFHALGVPGGTNGKPLSARADRLNALPRRILWAWEIPEDLQFIDPSMTGVAFLAETILISPAMNPSNTEGNVIVRRRRQPLRVPVDTPLMAVARIEDRAASRWTTAPVSEIAEDIAKLAELTGVSAIQVDFDATLSQREFYAAILRDLRRRMPADMPLSITALASWCLGDAWLDTLPVDEAVPMLFRMGVDDRNIRGLLADGRDFSSTICRASLGITTDEHMPVQSKEMLSGRRIYWFHPHPWTAAVFHDAVKGAEQ